MSTAATPTTDPHGQPPGDGSNGHIHSPHLAHHFDTQEQQFSTGKLGMWIFLGTEVLMFGGLFCAYSVYRHNHPEVFEFAHQYLNKWLGAINTVVLIASSLTMAWGVRAAQMGNRNLLVGLLLATLLGGYGFMSIKALEYRDKWEHHLMVGTANTYKLESQTVEDLIKNGNPPSFPAGHEGGHAAPGAEGAHAAPATAPATAPAAGGATRPAGHAPAAAPAGHEAAPAAATAGHEAAPAAGHDAHATPAPAAGGHDTSAHAAATTLPAAPATQPIAAALVIDPNAGTTDAAAIRPPTGNPSGLAPKVIEEHRHAAGGEHEMAAEYNRLVPLDKQRVYTFFQVYFVMTGLHGLHVLIGMGLIFWVLLKTVGKPAAKWVLPAGLMTTAFFLFYVLAIVHVPEGYALAANTRTIAWVIIALTGVWFLAAFAKSRSVPSTAMEFGPDYYAPVDIVGLYWHIVDLIWIFLFPLLYLIH